MDKDLAGIRRREPQKRYAKTAFARSLQRRCGSGRADQEISDLRLSTEVMNRKSRAVCRPGARLDDLQRDPPARLLVPSTIRGQGRSPTAYPAADAEVARRRRSRILGSIYVGCGCCTVRRSRSRSVDLGHAWAPTCSNQTHNPQRQPTSETAADLRFHSSSTSSVDPSEALSRR